MRKEHAQSFVLAAVAAGSALLVAPSAHASNPLEYPDNGTASFSRGGAWLATANEPIAAHYNPAALATQGSGFSIEQNMSYSKVCYDRRGPDGQPESAAPIGSTDSLQYLPTCNSRSGFPSTIPSISIAWRASKRLGFGFAIVPPATYGIADQQFPATSLGYNTFSKQYQQIPAPYRYQLLDQKSVIIYPTLSFGYELFKNFRVGAGFISGIAVINTTTIGVALENPSQTTDHAGDDGASKLTTRDMFVPGVVASLHWSVTPNIDVAAWGRWIDDVHTTKGDLVLSSQAYTARGTPGAPGFSELQPVCQQADLKQCGRTVAVPNTFGNDTFKEFRFPIPPEVRIGVRFHLPRSNGTAVNGGAKGPTLGLSSAGESRDPLHDDLFDLELDGSYTANSRANTIEVRFADNGLGAGATPINPVGHVPPNADRWNGYIDSYGIRFGGQVNVIQDKVGLRGGTWLETRSQDPAWLQLGVVGGMRGGFGGGIVLRQDFIDISLGYQHQWSNILDNGGHGAMRSTITSSNPEPDVTKDAGVSAANRTQYRTFHTVNDGRLSQSADVFSLGGTVHF